MFGSTLGSRDGAVVKVLQQMKPKCVSRVCFQCHICDKFVVFSSLFFPFFSGFCCFPPSTKSNISKVELSAVLQKQCKEKGEGQIKVVREVTVEGGMRELFKVLGIFKLWKKKKNIYIYKGS